jgi:hypothetical protein
MLIAALALLGVDLIVVAVLLTLVLPRRRWVLRQPGAFHGGIRVAGGEVDDLAVEVATRVRTLEPRRPRLDKPPSLFRNPNW